jgi:hypothetical protein
MGRDEVLKILITHQNALKTLGVSSLDLFGSVARDEARPDSDVDCLVEFTEKGGLFQLLRVQHYLEAILIAIAEIQAFTLVEEESCF